MYSSSYEFSGRGSLTNTTCVQIKGTTKHAGWIESKEYRFMRHGKKHEGNATRYLVFHVEMRFDVLFVKLERSDGPDLLIFLVFVVILPHNRLGRRSHADAHETVDLRNRNS